jgi:hypothetical protein
MDEFLPAVRGITLNALEESHKAWCNSAGETKSDANGVDEVMMESQKV